MQNADTWYAYFHVRGSFAPDDVTRRVGVTPTKTAMEGDAIGTTSKSRPCSLWALHSRLGGSAPLNVLYMFIQRSRPSQRRKECPGATGPACSCRADVIAFHRLRVGRHR